MIERRLSSLRQQGSKIPRIVLIGEFQEPYDEGMKNVMRNLATELSRDNEVTQLTLSNERHWLFKDRRFNFLSPSLAQQIKELKPSILHYFPISGITPASFIRAKVLAGYAQNAKTVVSCLQYSEKNSGLLIRAVPILKPDLILVQSERSSQVLRAMGIRTAFLPNGVDLEKFSQPRQGGSKEELRKKYGIPDKFVILHVGHLTDNRNIRALASLSGGNNLVIVVASTSTRADNRLLEFLKSKGVVVLRDYFENIQDIYNLSDCYVFPARNNSSCIEIPLSILEAMACNLPTISSRFGGLPDILEEGGGFYFADNIKEVNEKIQQIRNGVEITNRQKVSGFSWTNVAHQLKLIYRQVYDGKYSA